MPLNRRSATWSRPITALIAYDRPCDRSRLLRDVASLGIFVEEQSGGEPLPGARHDLAIACVTSYETTSEITRTISNDGSIPTVALFPSDYQWPDAEQMNDHCVTAVAREGDESIKLAIRFALSPENQTPSEGTANNDSDSIECLTTEGTAIRLSPAEQRVFTLLSRANGQPVAQNALAATSSSKSSLSEAYLKTLIFRLRRKLAIAFGDSAPTISAVRGYGYVLSEISRSSPIRPESNTR